MPVLVATLILCSSVGATPSSAPTFRGQGRAWLGAGYDSNASRDFLAPGRTAQGDGLLSALVNLDGALLFGRGRIAGSYDGGARKFLFLPAEDTLVQNAQLDATWESSSWLQLGLAGRARDRRGAERDYSDLIAEGVVDFEPDDAFCVTLRGGAHRFLFRPRFAASFWGPEFTFSARYRPNRKHAFTLFGTYSPHIHNGKANPRPTNTTPPDSEALAVQPTRRDTFMLGGLSYTWKGPVHLTVGYQYLDLASNSFGETLRRHRVSATLGARLPWKLTVLASGVLQLANYPDGVYLSPDVQVVEDDENSSAVTLKVVRPLSDRFDVDVRYAFYSNTLPRNEFLYFRHVVSAGLSVSF